MVWASMQDRIADRISARLWERLENDNTVPVPHSVFDVVVDDPDMFCRHEFRGVSAVSAKAAAVWGYRQAMRDEGHRCARDQPGGDEQTLAVAPECLLYVTVFLLGKHPAIEYEGVCEHG